jgi:hypothetical protein
MTEKLNKNQIKKLTRNKVKDAFTSKGCTIFKKTAGSVSYETIGLSGSDQRIGALYGSRGGACALWVKDDAWNVIKESGIVSPQTHTVQDVSMFARGFQWAIHFKDHNDSAIETVILACVSTGQIRWDATQERRAVEQRRASERVVREAAMSEKRSDPWA